MNKQTKTAARKGAKLPKARVMWINSIGKPPRGFVGQLYYCSIRPNKEMAKHFELRPELVIPEPSPQKVKWHKMGAEEKVEAVAAEIDAGWCYSDPKKAAQSMARRILTLTGDLP